MKKTLIIFGSILVSLALNTLPGTAKIKGIKIDGSIVAQNTSSLIVTVVGSALLGEDDTPRQTRTNALLQAKRNAAETALTKISSNTTVINNQVSEDIIMAKAKADVKVLEQENLPTINNEYRVKIKAEVRINTNPEKTSRLEMIDSEKPLKILAWLPKKKYKEGENLKFSLLTNKDAYLKVTYHSADGSIKQIFPNQYWHDNFVKGGEEITVPSAHINNFNFEITEPFGPEKIIVYAGSSSFDLKMNKEESIRGIKINQNGFAEFSEAIIELETFKY